jgi:DNA-binding transcriptional MerR regulator
MAENESLDYTIGQLAKLVKCSASSLRNWEKEGKIPQAKRTLGGHRRYTDTHVEAIASVMGDPRPVAVTE